MRSSIDFSPAQSLNSSRFFRHLQGFTPTGAQSAAALWARRAAFAACVAASIAALGSAFAVVLGHGGWTIPELVMFACFLASAPWIVIGFWNALIGFALLRLSNDPVALVVPCVANAGPDDAVTARVAIAMCVRHEDPARVVRRLDAVMRSLDATGHGRRFDVFVLSDSQKPELVEAEEAEIAAWRAMLDVPERVVYRRRLDNQGFKAGNIREFVTGQGRDYDLMITLDADSVMSGETILRLVRVMQANPKLGILQSVVMGLPARTVFARLFQFGMRASMRSYAMGEAWWTGDSGPYWGHNAAIRVKAFREHCRLPTVPGGQPLGGDVLSHDLFEAVLMRKGGYEVRVLPEEAGSWEDNPASLSEFLRRNLRWCQGNMQYLRLIGLPGLPLVGRVNLAIAIMMYVGAPAWILFMIASAAQAWGPAAVIGGDGPSGAYPFALSIGLLCTMMGLLFAPKIMGYLDVALSRDERRRYGGAGLFLTGAGAEGAFGLLFAPIVSFSVTAFLVRLFVFRRPVGWVAQDRDGARTRWSEALRMFWPATLFGAALAGSLYMTAPEVLPWAAPVLVAFIFATPFAVASSFEAPDAAWPRRRLAAIPEEFDAPFEVRMVGSGPASAAGYAPPMDPFRFDAPVAARRYPAYSAASPAAE